MRLLLVALAAVVTFPVIATAQTSKQVEVINFPNPQNVAGSVEVTNLPAVQDVNIVGGGTAPSSSRFQIVGFTTANYNGNLGGYFGATQKCQLEFPESRMCNPLEVKESTTLPGGLPNSRGSIPAVVSGQMGTEA